MPFNPDDYTKAPWTSGIMTLTHEEVLEVKTACQTIIDNFEPNDIYASPDTQYVVSTYNKQDWNKAINGDTYSVVMAYDPEYNTQGIDENGIVYSEEVAEEQTPADPEQPATEETTEEG
jgi:hypothetical protein